MSNVMIPYALLRALIRYHLFDDRDPELEEEIRSALTKKMDAAARRETYTKSLDHKNTPA